MITPEINACDKTKLTVWDPEELANEKKQAKILLNKASRQRGDCQKWPNITFWGPTYPFLG